MMYHITFSVCVEYLYNQFNSIVSTKLTVLQIIKFSCNFNNALLLSLYYILSKMIIRQKSDFNLGNKNII